MTRDRFIIRYAGAGVTFSHGALELVADHRADRWPDEVDAWLEARRQGLNLDRVTVVPLENFSSLRHNSGANYEGRVEAARHVNNAPRFSVALAGGIVRSQQTSTS